ncbi:OLC1v1037463C1 [Oldenlandia corymbosa var. corymbosa]|uniref:Coatomer subunit zeta n=1 Tax=Oldenlandia corymbosa var. corymbosa TaxID=529605 RepID=A0AAV1E4U9_OLDCO|nr:OLC1v1037463C1 [Oldenlandia corymbosa var. corymbosa]
MLLAVLIANSEGNILVERFNGVPAEERLHWRSFLVKLGADNLKGVKNEELLVASHKSVYIVYTVLGDVSIFVVGKDDYDELALSEAIFVITSAVKDVCGKIPTERLFLDKYGKICLCLDEIVWKVKFPKLKANFFVLQQETVECTLHPSYQLGILLLFYNCSIAAIYFVVLPIISSVQLIFTTQIIRVCFPCINLVFERHLFVYFCVPKQEPKTGVSEVTF